MVTERYLCSSWTDKKIIKKKKLFMKFQKLRGFLFDAYFSFVKNYTIRQLNVDSNKTSTPTISIYCKLQWYECMNRVPCSFIFTTITKLLTHRKTTKLHFVSYSSSGALYDTASRIPVLNIFFLQKFVLRLIYTVWWLC